MQRFYVVVRDDLDPGAQFAQGIHAASVFAHRYPTQHGAWQAGDPVLVVLSIPSEDALGELLRRATMQGVLACGFNEEDMNGKLTAAAFDGSVSKLVASLPLALRAVRVAA